MDSNYGIILGKMIYLNGKFFTEQKAKLNFNDRGFLLGDGIFETMRAYDGKIFCLSDHYERLKDAAHYLGIPFEYSLGKIKKISKELLSVNALDGKNASLRLTLTRGSGPRGLLPPKHIKSTLMFTAFPFLNKTFNPLNVVISPIRRNEFSPLSRIKSLCYLDNIIAKTQAVAKGADECILLNTQGNVVCGSAANLFIVTEKGIITPPVEDGTLPGITRKILIKICKEKSFPLFEETINQSVLIEVKEIFFTNQLIEIQPVIKINNHLINEGCIGNITIILKKHYKDFIKNSCFKLEAVNDNDNQLLSN